MTLCCRLLVTKGSIPSRRIQEAIGKERAAALSSRQLSSFGSATTSLLPHSDAHPSERARECARIIERTCEDDGPLNAGDNPFGQRIETVARKEAVAGLPKRLSWDGG